MLKTLFICFLFIFSLCFDLMYPSMPAYGFSSVKFSKLNDFPSSHSLAIPQYTTPAFFWNFFRSRPKQKGSSSPSNTVSNGRRGECSQIGEGFVGLVPPTSSDTTLEERFYLGLTLRPDPYVWFYLANLPNNLVSFEWMLQNAQGEDALSKPISIPLSSLIQSNVPGVYGAQIPTLLELNRAYQWYLSLICDEKRPSHNPSISAWIEYVELSSKAEEEFQLAESEADRAKVYLDDGIWHDTLTILSQEEMTEELVKLLQSSQILDLSDKAE